ncbi:MAG: right-handed parallel beta-helix repeat-containing protein [Actinomycetota bacterium]|nr:right-handed parallel beta-helix repeat-containing protein [Actinomycetota bacterium]
MLAILLLAASPGHAQTQPAEESECRPPERRPSAAEELYKGTDPSRNLLAYSPDRILQYPCPYPAEYRGIIVRPDQVLMVQGGQLVRRIRVGAEGTATTFTLPRLAALVGDRSWIGEVAPGVFQVDAAIQQRDSTLLVTGPDVKEVRLTTRPHVFMGGIRSQALFQDVKVTSWDPAGNGPDLNPVDGRPFIVYESGSRLDIGHSEFTHLGSDRTSAYGVTWRTLGTTGRVLDSVFSNNFFGAYSFEAANIEFRRNVFRNNAYYGLDPHTATTGLVVEDNEAYGNGTHGIIFSQYVTDSVLRNNRLYRNGSSGIVLHARSDRNRVEGNVAENNGEDGIVIIGSGHNVVTNNTIRHNHVGIRVNDLGSDRNEIVGNTVEDNAVGVKIYGGAIEAALVDNTVRRSAEKGVVLDAPMSKVVRTNVQGAPRGLELDGVVDVRDTNIGEVDEGIRAAPTAIVDLRNVTVAARRTGARFQPGAITTMHEVDFTAPTAVVRPGGSSSSWTDYLPFVGLAAVALAVGLDVLRRVRNRDQPTTQAPPQVLNSA